MKLGIHMPDGERRKPIDLQVTVLFLEIVILTFDPQTSSS
jgi:hypothetical protein